MKKLLKPEIELIKLENADVITTSLGDTYTFGQGDPQNTSGNAHDSQYYGNGENPLWNR